MKTLIGVLFWLAAANVFAADGVKVIYDVDGQPYEGYFISPGPHAPLVLLVHDWDGLTEYEVKRAQMLSAQGYAVFAADLFGAGIRPTEVKDRRQHTGELYKDRAKMRRLLNGALASAKFNGADVQNAMAVGYCFGGAAVLEMARSGAPLKGFVSIHGGLDTPDGQDYSQTQGQVLVLHGAADQNIGMDKFARLAEQLEAQKIPHEMIAYGGAPHAFTVFGDRRYHKSADEKSWNRLTDFLDRILVTAKHEATD